MIEVTNLRKSFRGRPVLKDVSFTAEKGRITCLIGENGAGKSTVLKAIMGLIPSDGGRILIDGRALAGRDLYTAAAFIPDRLAMPGGMRLKDALSFMQTFYPNWNARRAEELMAFFRLDPAAKIGDLSKGTAAKFNLVLGFALDVSYVLMDEPFAGIDLFSREQIAKVFANDLIEERGVLMTTHEIGELEHLVDKAVLLKDGVIVRGLDCEQLRLTEGKSVIDVMREVYAP
jgi:ABC-2 type transport system ATP-binding protein